MCLRGGSSFQNCKQTAEKLKQFSKIKESVNFHTFFLRTWGLKCTFKGIVIYNLKISKKTWKFKGLVIFVTIAS